MKYIFGQIVHIALFPQMIWAQIDCHQFMTKSLNPWVTKKSQVELVESAVYGHSLFPQLSTPTELIIILKFFQNTTALADLQGLTHNPAKLSELAIELSSRIQNKIDTNENQSLSVLTRSLSRIYWVYKTLNGYQHNDINWLISDRTADFDQSEI